MSPPPAKKASTSAQQLTPALVVAAPTDPRASATAEEPLSPASPCPIASSSTARAGSSRKVVDSTKPIITTIESSSESTTQAPTRRGSADGPCEACTLDRPYVDRIRTPSHTILALRLLFSDKQRRRQLFTNWVHVPIGIASLLFLVWMIKQAMDRAPFRFPSPVLAMVLLFVMLLFLDYLSTRSFVQARLERGTEGKVLLQPMLALLEAPCDFCLRYMGVMFTPSFILIPAREIINGKEIGLITGWFAASQIAALVFPVLLHKLIHWTVAKTRYHLIQRKDRQLEKSRRTEEQRRASVATLVAVMSNIKPLPPTKAETRISFSDLEEGCKPRLVGGEKLGSVATGLSGMTAIATAPLTVSIATPAVETRGQAEARKDAQRQLEQVQLETARQQGDPYAMVHTRLADAHHHYPTPASPRSASSHHNHRLHQSSDYFASRRTTGRGASEMGEGAQGVGRSRSLARSWASRVATSLSPTRAPRSSSGDADGTRSDIDMTAMKGKLGAVVVGPGSGLKSFSLPGSRRPQSANAASDGSGKLGVGTIVDATLSPTFDEYIFKAREDLIRRNSPLARNAGDKEEESVDPSDEGTGAETLVMPTLVPPTPIRLSQEVELAGPRSPTKASNGVRRASKANSEMIASKDNEKLKSNATRTPPPAQSQEQEEQLDAIDTLIQRLWTLIPWVIFTLVLIAGVPIFYVLDVSLPLFLAVNLLTFLCSITLVPAKIRRYAHPILTTSVATVFILWAIGAIRGWTLRRTLESYSVDAKYTVLWSLSGYTGPVIGAGDLLFSTLDVGIVSLAVPMYRYRWDLWFHLIDMLVVLFPCSLLSLFLWPTVAGVIGIAPERALAFASRFMSTPLAIELSLTIGADDSITVVLVVITGILISIFKDPFFRLFGLNPDLDGPQQDSNCGIVDKRNQDYLTIGIAVGSTAGAIGASSLISKPRCMAIASLSFVLFGAILLIFAAIPPVVDTMRMLARAPLQFLPAS
ncbi:hypothetical protein NDA18_004846 [Ustilago nuda]|nr:hypothetical protein NDA18_004846 [Ustilago nuda]